ncbi:MAG: hypothetical protein QOF73_2956, partial [Thermomicrobiales bacterium]|nr:hypothetical protein [Thermomicrobiales bacterium]
RHEAGGTIDSDEYRSATDAYYARHLCRGASGAEIAVFEARAHLPHLKDREAYLAAVGELLRRLERPG